MWMGQLLITEKCWQVYLAALSSRMLTWTMHSLVVHLPCTVWSCRWIPSFRRYVSKIIVMVRGDNWKGPLNTHLDSSNSRGRLTHFEGQNKTYSYCPCWRYWLTWARTGNSADASEHVRWRRWTLPWLEDLLELMQLVVSEWEICPLIGRLWML